MTTAIDRLIARITAGSPLEKARTAELFRAALREEFAALFGALADSMVDGPNTLFHSQRTARDFETACREMIEERSLEGGGE